MSPLSTSVLAGGALLASPALYQSLVDGTLPLDVALTRFLVALVACWLALTVLTEFVLPRPDPEKGGETTARAADPPPAASHASPQAEKEAPEPLFDTAGPETEHALEGPAG